MSLDDVLIDPETREPVKRATEAQLAALKDAIARGGARRNDGGPLPAGIEAAYLSHGGRWAYVVTDGIPSFLVEMRVELDAPLEK